jgi:hypothetical protein
MIGNETGSLGSMISAVAVVGGTEGSEGGSLSSSSTSPKPAGATSSSSSAWSRRLAMTIEVLLVQCLNGIANLLSFSIGGSIHFRANEDRRMVAYLNMIFRCYSRILQSPTRYSPLTVSIGNIFLKGIFFALHNKTVYEWYRSIRSAMEAMSLSLSSILNSAFEHYIDQTVTPSKVSMNCLMNNPCINIHSFHNAAH